MAEAPPSPWRRAIIRCGDDREAEAYTDSFAYIQARASRNLPLSSQYGDWDRFESTCTRKQCFRKERGLFSKL